MHLFFVCSILTIIILYSLFVISLMIGLRRLSSGTNTTQYSVSIVVAARNEEQSLPACIEALLAQDYPSEKLEIIIVNDRSEDKTGKILERYAEKKTNLKYLTIQSVPEYYAPKKYALSKGVEATSGEIICTTDADCVPPATWVSELISHFTSHTGFVAGFSPVYPTQSNEQIDDQNNIQFRLFKRWYIKLVADFMNMDSIGLAVASAGGIALDMPWTCAGRNLAYRKEAFQEVGGFDNVKHILSGDDDLLMFLIHYKSKWKLRYAANKRAAVPTFDDTKPRKIAQQRVRHASKFFDHPLRVKTTSVVVFLFYCLFMFSPLLIFISWQGTLLFGLIAGVKLLLEYFSVRKGARLFQMHFSYSAFLKAYLIHPPVTVLASLFGSTGTFSWKS